LAGVRTPSESARTIDDLGSTVLVPRRVRRVVSLVPSLTEALACTARGLLVGATDWCSHPPDLDVVRVRGTKNPDIQAVIGLSPDLVLANQEENRGADLDALRAAGIAVYVTDIRSLDGAFDSLGRMLAACGLDPPPWLTRAEGAWQAMPPAPERLRAVVPIWRRPWMALGQDTFAGDVLRRLGVDNVLAGAAERYPRFAPADLPEHDVVVLPDEPYRFTAEDGPESFQGTPAVLVSGRLLTWYGPSLQAATTELPKQLAVRLRGGRGV
jgi:ABC-type Fe3+-hydroxamate transport system substrate-binding protein